MFTPELNTELLEENLYALLERHHLDEYIEALEGACRRRAGDLQYSDDGDYYLNLATELRELKGRDYTPADSLSPNLDEVIN